MAENGWYIYGRNLTRPDQYLWGQPPPPSGIVSRAEVAKDRRAKRTLWDRYYLGSPIHLEGKIYITTSLGLIYVIDSRAKTLDRQALLAVNYLGPAVDTRSHNAFSCANGRLYHRDRIDGKPYVVCIGAQ